MAATKSTGKNTGKDKSAAGKTSGKTGKSLPSAQQFRFGYIIHDVSRVRRTVMDHAMRPLGLTRSQWSMLGTLSRSGNNGMMQADIARLMDVGKVTIGGLVDRLEATGHVQRRPDEVDRRAKRVFITEQGYQVISEMIGVVSDLNERSLEGIPPENVKITEDTLFQVKANLKSIMDDFRRSGKSEEFHTLPDDDLPLSDLD